MKIERLSSQRATAAFTLVEVVVGMLVIGISVVALYGAISSAYNTICFARENLRATEILTEKTEALRLYDWDQIIDKTFVPNSFAVPFDPLNTNAPGPTYNGTIKIKNLPHAVSYAGDMRLVTIDLQWISRGRTRARQFTTYVARAGIQNYRY